MIQYESSQLTNHLLSVLSLWFLLYSASLKLTLIRTFIYIYIYSPVIMPLYLIIFYLFIYLTQAPTLTLSSTLIAASSFSSTASASSSSLQLSGQSQKPQLSSPPIGDKYIIIRVIVHLIYLVCYQYIIFMNPIYMSSYMYLLKICDGNIGNKFYLR